MTDGRLKTICFPQLHERHPLAAIHHERTRSLEKGLAEQTQKSSEKGRYSTIHRNASIKTILIVTLSLAQQTNTTHHTIILISRVDQSSLSSP